MYITRNSHRIRIPARPEHLGIEADGYIKRILSRQKHKRIPSRTKLAVLLPRIHLVDFGLHPRRRRGRAKDKHIGSEDSPRCDTLCPRASRKK
jgi:hypothetical protein